MKRKNTSDSAAFVLSRKYDLVQLDEPIRFVSRVVVLDVRAKPARLRQLQ